MELPLASHRFRIEPYPFAPLAVGDRRDLGGLDLASAAPEYVRVADRNADRLQVRVDSRLPRGRTIHIARISHAEKKNIAKRVEDSRLVAVESSRIET